MFSEESPVMIKNAIIPGNIEIIIYITFYSENNLLLPRKPLMVCRQEINRNLLFIAIIV